MYEVYYYGRLELNREPSDKVKRFFEKLAEWDLRDNKEIFHTSPGRKDIPDSELRSIIVDTLEPEGLVLNGTICWDGDKREDLGKIVVRDNKVTVYYANITYKDCDGRTESETEEQRAACAG